MTQKFTRSRDNRLHNNRHILILFVVVLLFSFSVSSDAISSPSVMSPPAQDDVILKIPTSSVETFVVTNLFVADPQRGEIVFGEPVPWTMTIEQQGQAFTARYTTPAIQKTELYEKTNEGGVHYVDFITSYEGLYTNVTFSHQVNPSPYYVLKPALEYTLLNDNTIEIMVPRINQSFSFTIEETSVEPEAIETELEEKIENGTVGNTEEGKEESKEPTLELNQSNAVPLTKRKEHVSLRSVVEGKNEPVQLPAEIGKPVQWVMPLVEVNVTIPPEANDVALYDEQETMLEDDVFKEEKIVEVTKREVFTTSGVSRQKEELVGKKIVVNESKATLLTYETPAPQLVETKVSSTVKNIRVESPRVYEDVLLYTDTIETPEEDLQIYLVVNGTDRIQQHFSGIDRSGNGRVDRVYWVADELSDQTYEIQRTLRGRATHSQFTGKTTDFTNHPTPANVSGAIIEKEGKGSIAFSHSINTLGQDLNTYIAIDHNFVSVDSDKLHESMNLSATITLTDLEWDSPVIFRNGKYCEACIPLSYEQGEFVFSVPGFSNYTTGAETSLNISDDTDTLPREYNEVISFAANYTNTTNSAAINGSDAYCRFSENSGGSFSAPVNMTFDSGTRLYQINQSFTTPGTYRYNVSCFNAQEFANVSTLDTFIVNPDFTQERLFNVSQLYAPTYNQIVNASPIDPQTVNISSETLVDSGFFHSTSINQTRLYINETSTYKISYMCGYQYITHFDTNSRVLVDAWVEVNNETEIVPSRTSCYLRRDDQGDRCSNAGVLLANLTRGDYIELRSAIIDQDNPSVVETYDQCGLYAQRVKNPVAQIYDFDGGDTFTEGGEITVSFDTISYVDTRAMTAETSTNSINVTQDGWYKLYYHVCADAGADNSRVTTHSRIQIDGSYLIPGDSYSYTRENSVASQSCTQAFVLTNLTSGQGITIHHKKNDTLNGGGETSPIRGNETWLLVERIQSDNVFTAHDVGGGQTIGTTNTLITYDTRYHASSEYTFTPGGSAITVGRAGLYEISYGLSWDDGEADNRRTICGFLRIDGSTQVNPSRQCEYSRGSNGNDKNTVRGNALVDLTEGQYVELLGIRTGSAVTVVPNGAWISIVPVRQDNLDSPKFSNITVNDTILGANEVARFYVNVTDVNNSIDMVNATIEGVNYNFSLLSGDLWYYDWACIVSDNEVNITYIYARDAGEPYNDNSTTASLSIACDATAPTSTSVTINDTSLATFGSVVNVNATIADVENNTDTVLLEITPPGLPAYNTSVQNLSAVYYNDSILLDRGGQWTFRFFVNDTSNNRNISPLAQDGGSNFYIDVDASGDSDNPYFENATVNDTLLGFNETARFSIQVLDDTSSINFTNGTIDGVLYNFTYLSGTTWYYDWTCLATTNPVNLTQVWANDTAGNFNTTSVVGVGLECDAGFPLFNTPEINETSIVLFNTTVKVNATVTDPESNLDTVYLEVSPPLSSSYSVGTSQNGNEFFNDTVRLDQAGRWAFRFYANDSANNTNNSVLAQDGGANMYIEVNRSPAYYNISQIFISINNQNITTGQLLDSNFTNVTYVDTTFTHNISENSSRLYVEKNGWHKISYACTYEYLTQFDTNSRVTIDSYIRVDGSSEVSPSRTRCYARETATGGDLCSNSGTLLANLAQGQYIELIGNMSVEQNTPTTIGVDDDCMLSAQLVKNDIVQVYDTNGGDAFSESTEINVTFDTLTYNSGHFVADAVNHAINITETGWYKMYYHICSNTAAGTDRVTTESYVKRNGQRIVPSTVYSYLRDQTAGNDNCAQGVFVYNFTAGDSLKIGHLKNYTETAAQNAQTIAGQSWMVVEKLESKNNLLVYDAGGGTTLSTTSTSIDLDTTYHTGTAYTHSGTQIFFNTTGMYEVAYGFSWDDSQAGGRMTACAFIRKDGSEIIDPSRQCDYSRGTTGNGINTVSGNFIMNASVAEYIQLRGVSAGGGSGVTEQDAVWISINPLRLSDTDFPSISNVSINTTRAVNNTVIRHYATITDASSDIEYVNATYNGSEIMFSHLSGDLWHYDTVCTASHPVINLTFIEAADATVPQHIQSSVVGGIGYICDITVPLLENASINQTSLAPFNSIVKVNASMIDVEGNNDTLLLEINPPGLPAFNTTPPRRNNTEYYNDSILLDRGGQWVFTFYVNDSAGNTNSIVAQDLASNFYIDVDATGDTDFPQFENATVNTTTLGFNQTARFSLDVIDNTSSINFTNGTINGTSYNFSLDMGSVWYADWTCLVTGISINFTDVWANDTVGNSNMTNITGVGLECDAGFPLFSNTLANVTSNVSFGSMLKVNTSVSDPEGHLLNVTLQIDPPLSAAYNTTTILNGSEYYNDSILLDQNGTWIFTFFANDTFGNINSTLVQDGASNFFVHVARPLPIFNVSQIYDSVGGQNVPSGGFLVTNLSNVTFVDTNFTYGTTGVNLSRLYVESTGLYKISYACGYEYITQQDTNSRVTVATFIEQNNTDEIIPSRTECYLRNDGVGGNLCSNTATFITNLTEGDFIHIESVLSAEQNAPSVVETDPTCWMYAQFVGGTPVAQIYDFDGGDIFDENTPINITFDTETFVNSSRYSSDFVNDALDINQPGWYKLYYHTCSNNVASTTRVTPITTIVQNNGSLPETGIFTFLRNQAGGQRACGQGVALRYFNSSEQIKLRHVKNITETASENTVTVGNQSWLTAEHIPSDNVFLAIDSVGNLSIGASATAINLYTHYRLGANFEHATNTSEIAINKSGLYEVSYVFSWYDLEVNDRRTVCSYLRLNGTDTIYPSQQCDYSRGIPGNGKNTIGGTFIYNFTEDDYIELMAYHSGLASYTTKQGVWLMITPLNYSDNETPRVSGVLPTAGTSYFANDSVSLSANVTDDIELDTVYANISYPNGTNLTLSLSNNGGLLRTFNGSFTIPNVVGQFNVTIFANDTLGKINYSETTYFTNEGYLIVNPPTGTTYVRADNTSQDVTTVAQSGTVEVLGTPNGSTNYSGVFTIDFSSHVDFSTVILDLNQTNRTSVVHNSSAVGEILNRSLLIPRVTGSGAVYICPGAELITHVNMSCPNFLRITTGQRIAGMTMSETTYDSENYYRIDNITGTGGGEEDPDLTIVGINFSTLNAVEGESINVTVNVSNSGANATTNFTVQLNVSIFNGTWDFNQTINSSYMAVGNNTSAVVDIPWTVLLGTARMHAYADNLYNITENNETNNNLSVNHTQESWEIQYGIASLNLTLANLAGDATFDWQQATPVGNQFYADTDASFEVSDLAGLTGANDLAEADTSLNMTYFNDSISNLFDLDGNGNEDMNKTITILGSPVIVPVINTTNSSSFITGLLYDTADGVGYDGSQDLIIVTQINASQVGAYGTYDYEVRIPARLRLHRGTTQTLERTDEVI